MKQSVIFYYYSHLFDKLSTISLHQPYGFMHLVVILCAGKNSQLASMNHTLIYLTILQNVHLSSKHALSLVLLYNLGALVTHIISYHKYLSSEVSHMPYIFPGLDSYW